MSKIRGDGTHGKGRDLKLEARWRKMLGRQERSGLTAREFCRREGVKESAFHFWKRELRRRDAAAHTPQRKEGAQRGRPRERTGSRGPALVPVTIGPAWGTPPSIEVLLSHGVSVRVESGCEEALLRMVFSALSQIEDSPRHGGSSPWRTRRGEESRS
jgi:transposase